MPGMRRSTAAVLLAALVLGSGAALAACGSDDDDAAGTTDTTVTTTTETEPPTTTTATEPPPPPPGPTVVRVRVVNGAPQGGIARETVEKGDRVVVVVTSDVSDHVHVHGYDRFADVGPGRRARIEFRARLVGRFVIELEDRHAEIAQLTVNP